MPGTTTPLRALAVFLGLLSGCTGPSFTYIRPSHFQFVEINKPTVGQPSGWRAACIHALVYNAETGEPYGCEFGVEMPIQNEDGPISTRLAQRISADCARVAASRVLDSTLPTSGPGLVCIAFRRTYQEVLSAAVQGARVPQTCDKRTTPVEVRPEK